jgi:hypothetical protein
VTGPLIVGDGSDGHVVAVAQELRRRTGQTPMLIDAPALMNGDYALSGSVLRVGEGIVDLADFGRGWLRRYAPSMWGAGLVAGTLPAVRLRAFLGLVGSISRLGNWRWLTGLDDMLRAEDRLLQLDQVRRLGFLVPRSVVASDGAAVRAALGDQFVVKPLSQGYFHADDGPRAVFASLMTSADLDHVDFGDAPFVAQERIDVREHLRVVTVGSLGWVAVLDADGRPLDWRKQDEAHDAWVTTDAAAVVAKALEVARAFRVGYSSQDWVRNANGDEVFLDLNPGGQWLFLPPDTADRVTSAIASYLAESAT